MMKKSAERMGEGMNRRRRRADSDSGIYSFGSASSARERLSRSLKIDHGNKNGFHDYNWRQNIMMDARDSHDIDIRDAHDLYKTVPSDHDRLVRQLYLISSYLIFESLI